MKMTMKKLPLIGIYTPIHKINYEYLDFLVKSLEYQTYNNFKWCICLNGELYENSQEWEKVLKTRYPKIDILFCKSLSNKIGQLKGHAVTTLIDEGVDILLELDYDDALNEDTLIHLQNEYLLNYESTKLLFFYSNFAHFDANEATYSATYGEYYGWTSRPHESKLFDLTLNETIAYPPEDIFLVRIESTPNHLRAFTKEMYKYCGGYSDLEVGDDHELILRMRLCSRESKLIKIDKCLYYQRYGHGSTTFEKNDLIQKTVQENQNIYQSRLFDKHDRYYISNKTESLFSKYFIRKVMSNLICITIDIDSEEELLEMMIKFHEEVYDLLLPGGVFRVNIKKDINVKKALTFMVDNNFQYHSWTEDDDTFTLYFTPFKGWYKYIYWGTPQKHNQ